MEYCAKCKVWFYKWYGHRCKPLTDSAIYQDSYAELTLKRHLQNTESRLSTLINQALAEDRERMRGEIKERKIPEIIDLKYFEKDGIGKTLLLKMTHNTAYNYGLKHGYNQAIDDITSLDKPVKKQ